jgi:hypothetical protein
VRSICFNSWRVVRMSWLGKPAINWPIVPAPNDDNRYVCGAVGESVIWGNRSIRRKSGRVLLRPQ